MAQFSISPQQPFNPSEPENWEKWSTRWDCFFTGSGLGKKDEAVQEDTLSYCMREEAEAILKVSTYSYQLLTRTSTRLCWITLKVNLQGQRT